MTENNILILNSSAIYGGGEYFVIKLAGQLVTMGYIITIGCAEGTPLFEKAIKAGINTVTVGFPAEGTGSLGKNIKAIRKLIVENNFKIVHTNTNYDRTAGAFAYRGTMAKHITSCHSLESLSHNITHSIRNKYLTEHFICDGKSIRDLIVNKNHIPLRKTTVVNNGIDPVEMKRDPERRSKVRKEFNIRENEIVIGNTGRMVGFKGQKYLLAAFKTLSESCSNIRLMITGDGELMDDLKERTASMQISEKVVFTGFREDLQAVYSAFDIYVHPSLNTGGELFPFSVLYAMAQALPVIASRSGDVPDMITDKEGGYLTDERSPLQIFTHLNELIHDPSLMKSMGNRNLETLKQRFTLDIMAQKISKIYETALNTRK